MTELKNIHCDPILYEHLTGWYTPAKWMLADEVDFRFRVVKIDGQVYTEYSVEFAKKFNQDRIVKLLQQ